LNFLQAAVSSDCVSCSYHALLSIHPHAGGASSREDACCLRRAAQAECQIQVRSCCRACKAVKPPCTPPACRKGSALKQTQPCCCK
jgi:hypothetical protein